MQITQKKLNEILKDHALWLKDHRKGHRADLSGMNLDGALLNYALLDHASLNGALLNYASLNGASLNGASLDHASLNGALLNGASLNYASLNGATIDINDLNKVWPIACPETGAFIGWKKAGYGLIVKLEILENAKRSSATSRKCRCSAAKVLAIENEDGMPASVDSVCSKRDAKFIYKVGEIVKVDVFDEDRKNECSTGIHFFITRQEAVDY